MPASDCWGDHPNGHHGLHYVLKSTTDKWNETRRGRCELCGRPVKSFHLDAEDDRMARWTHWKAEIYVIEEIGPP